MVNFTHTKTCGSRDYSHTRTVDKYRMIIYKFASILKMDTAKVILSEAFPFLSLTSSQCTLLLSSPDHKGVVTCIRNLWHKQEAIEYINYHIAGNFQELCWSVTAKPFPCVTRPWPEDDTGTLYGVVVEGNNASD